MKILITNDDGIKAPGLMSLLKIAKKLTSEAGNIWIVAPNTEKSGVGHCVSLSTPVRISKLEERTFSVEGSPADCVVAGVHYVLKDNPPDLILSGVNRGNNSAENALYSGTLGAALEGALQGITSVALSQYLGPKNISADNPFECSEVYGASVIEKILRANLTPDNDYKLFYNVNFPPCLSSEVNGTKVAPQGYRTNAKFAIDPIKSPSLQEFFFLKGSNQQLGSPHGSDAAENIKGYISVTPMRGDLTAYDALENLRAIE